MWPSSTFIRAEANENGVTSLFTTAIKLDDWSSQIVTKSILNDDGVSTEQLEHTISTGLRVATENTRVSHCKMKHPLQGKSI